MTTTPSSVLDACFPGENYGFDALDYIHKYGKGSWALLFSNLFVPDFIELDGSVLLANTARSDEAKERFTTALTNKQMTRPELESSFNLLEVGYLFDAAGRDTSETDDMILAQSIGEALRRSLLAMYPNREFEVRVSTPSESGSTASVSFFEKR